MHANSKHVDMAMRSAVLREMVKSWLARGTDPSAAMVREWMESTTDEAFADACIEGWRLESVCSGAKKPWLDFWQIERDDLVKAFAEHRKRVGARQVRGL